MFALRDLRATDSELLALATLGNMNWSGPRFTAEQVRTTPELARYWRPPADPRDLGLVAEAAAEGAEYDETAGGPAIGVGWLRHLTSWDPGFGFVDTSIPELSVWVQADHRGRGVGGVLLTSLIDRARRAELPGISLSVEAGNPARRLYERCGFVPAGGDHDEGTLLLML